MTDFNPRSREGSDCVAAGAAVGCVSISIHAPARGATHLDKSSIEAITNFNPRSREGSDSGWDTDGRRYIISIHAPARGATREKNVISETTDISIHAPARGATGAGMSYPIHSIISIHAPARGATI